MGKALIYFFFLSSLFSYSQGISLDTCFNARIKEYIDNKFSASDSFLIGDYKYFMIVRNGTCYTLCNEKLYYFIDQILAHGDKKFVILTNKHDSALINRLYHHNDNDIFFLNDPFELSKFALDGIDHLLVYLNNGKIINHYKISHSNYRKVIKLHQKVFRNQFKK